MTTKTLVQALELIDAARSLGREERYGLAHAALRESLWLLDPCIAVDLEGDPFGWDAAHDEEAA